VEQPNKEEQSMDVDTGPETNKQSGDKTATHFVRGVLVSFLLFLFAASVATGPPIAVQHFVEFPDTATGEIIERVVMSCSGFVSILLFVSLVWYLSVYAEKAFGRPNAFRPKLPLKLLSAAIRVGCYCLAIVVPLWILDFAVGWKFVEHLYGCVFPMALAGYLVSQPNYQAWVSEWGDTLRKRFTNGNE
jgi:hypothetical protein